MEDEFSWAGVDSVRREGLVDSAEEQEFYNSLEVLCGTWAMGQRRSQERIRISHSSSASGTRKQLISALVP